MHNSKEIVKLFSTGLLNSYSQIFFSNNKVFASILLTITFFDIGAGLSGIISVLIGQITALLFNFNRELIRDGTYTYNSVLVGIALGMFYEFNLSFFILIVITSVFVFFITIWFLVSFSKKGIPFLSVPFLVAVWIVILGADNFSSLALKQKEFFSLAMYFPYVFEKTTAIFGSLPFSNAIYLYLRSLGAIFFQYNDLAGFIIAIGLLINSRISFVLSIFGFLIGYLFYSYFEGDFSQLIYSYIGFNFILTAIALGGFFVVASKRSFLLLLFAIPTIALLISGLQSIFILLNLPLYSLPFNIVVCLFIMALQARVNAQKIQLVTFQQFSIEKNHYAYVNHMERFSANTYSQIGLPIMGSWDVSQAYDGDETHKTDWKHALDFVIVDEESKTFKFPGYELNDYYCYDLPVIAPAHGTVIKILDEIDDNKVGDVNLENNWGNTVIIKHSDFLYSKLSHLKKNSLQVKLYDYVSKGSIIGYCGNSGRSPEPHLHFQMQATPYIGSKTISYPISYYLTNHGGKFSFHSFKVPKKNEKVSNVVTTPTIRNAFSFISGKTLEFEVISNKKAYHVTWEIVLTDTNKTYLYCKKTNSIAYFVNNGTMFYFTDFYGDKSSFLHYFYLGLYKVLLGYYQDLELKDSVMISSVFHPVIKAIHDLTAPFFHYCKGDYQLQYISADEVCNPSVVSFNTQCVGVIFKKEISKISYNFTIENDQIATIKIKDNNTLISARCIN